MRTYFCKSMVADSHSFSPSASKPGLVIADWLDAGLDLDVKKPWPASPKTLSLAHDPAYIQGLLACSIPNGFGNTDARVAASLPFTVGAMVCAAKHAQKTGENAAALCSGFHHAGYNGGGGFCSINGLVIAAMAVRGTSEKARVGILDLDQHYGNGTDDIIRKLKLDWIRHFTAGATFSRAEQAEGFLKALPAVIKRKFYDCEVLIYQAGADPYVNDPLGGWLTMEQLRERDRIVFETCRSMRLPVAWNLAGGYTKDKNGGISEVLAIHRATAEECIAATTAAKSKRRAS